MIRTGAGLGQGDFRFYFVQLANFTNLATARLKTSGGLREAPEHDALPENTGMAVAIERRRRGGIHPKDSRRWASVWR